MYRLVEENRLKRLIEAEIIYNELCAQGVDNWIGCDEVHFPDNDEIKAELNKFDKFEERDYDD